MIAISSDNVVRVSVKDGLSGEILDDATLTGQLYLDGASVLEEGFSLDWDETASEYRGTLAADLELEEGTDYILQVTVVSGDNTLVLRNVHRAEYEVG